jgi:hypothetical protein
MDILYGSGQVLRVLFYIYGHRLSFTDRAEVLRDLERAFLTDTECSCFLR